MLTQLLFIGFGGAIGAVMRFVISTFFATTTFPYGTLVANLGGSFVIGLLWVLFEEKLLPTAYKPLLITGLVGALTTFSTYSLENILLLEDGETITAITNIIVTNVLGMACVYIGITVGRLL